MSNNRALEMFQSGQAADCVIEVMPQIDGQEKQVFLLTKFRKSKMSQSDK
jgi:hypothetical protein